MDDVWDKAWEAAFGSSPLPDVTWAIFPQHPFTVGTYSYPLPGNGWLAWTQGTNSWRYKSAIIDLAPDLHSLAWHRTIPAKDEAALRELGLLDTSANLRAFAYHRGDDVDRLIQELVSEYATALARIHDYKALAKSLGITP